MCVTLAPTIHMFPLKLVKIHNQTTPGRSATRRHARRRGSPGGSEPGFFYPNRITQTAGHRFRFTGPVGPETGGNRLNSNPNSNKFKNSRATGSDRFTGRFDRFTGQFYRFTSRFDRFEFKSKFKSSRATGLPTGFTGLPAGLAGGP